jgi:hypothetical protein
MRRDGDAFIGCELSLRERDAVDEMKARTGILTDANLVRTALYRFAAHVNVDADTGLFAVRGRQDRHSVSRARRAAATSP